MMGWGSDWEWDCEAATAVSVADAFPSPAAVVESVLTDMDEQVNRVNTVQGRAG